MIEIKKHKFKSGAMSVIQMGEEQIGHPSTAINELVKNAYDADADKCWVYTQYDRDSSRNFIIIKDNGLGMSSSTLFGDWLITSKSSKRDEDKESRKSEIYERRYLGSKGIGRLAAMSLGRFLTVITKKKKENSYHWLRIDREIFRVENLLDTVEFSGGDIEDYKLLFSDEQLLSENGIKKNGNLINILSEEPFTTFEEGTTIILQDVDASVQAIIEEENTLNVETTTFYKALSDLVTPLKMSNKIQKELVDEGIIKEELKISNGIDTFDLLYGINFIKNQIKNKVEFIPVEPAPIIDKFDYRVFGKVTENNSVEGKYVCKRLPEDEFTVDFNLSSEYILSDEDLNKRQAIKFEDIPTKYRDSNLGEFYFDFRIYDLEDNLKDKLADLLNAKSRREAMHTMTNVYLGVKVTKNGFGVKPYGEGGQDWLGLGAQRVKRHKVTVGPNQILGYTFLYSPMNDGLSEKTNREGFYENRAFIVLKKSITGILQDVGQRRHQYRLKHKLAEKNRLAKNKFERPDSENFIKYLAAKTNNDTEVMRLSKEFIDETNATLDNMQESLTLSQRLATLGISLELVYHELAQPVAAIGGSLNAVKINLKKSKDENLKELLGSSLNNIGLSLDAIEELKESLQPAIGKTKQHEFKPVDVFKKVLYLFKDKIEQQKVDINIAIALNNLIIEDLEYPLWVAFLNIVNNAMYWLQFKSDDRFITIDIIDSNTLLIKNNGPKIDEDQLELIFEYGVTGKKERNATGLGLAFTRSLLDSINWEVWAENHSDGPAFIIKKLEKK